MMFMPFLERGNIALYKLKDDPKEGTNLADTHPRKAEELLNELIAWRTTNQVPVPPSTAPTLNIVRPQ